ncbi:uncharacterized protein LOC123554333 [Mercenaria mercenaria]|uniref:uncharacterized protein LOC123554333 n=1 Tax=Mercenaria mercenaria TaxID=6596 RepID=UPI00234FA59D|nr:uncharacterized protein LOC123554333 [Mercenaria mercenaria]XP_045200346.2 uncharacterized protein LOC123554333 [Mercenaria mercenaria]XP_045200347.2 uncharacterized protein LOC123554333 [Mercenaria mercenaria]
MIISTVNFVNNYKFSDFILDKISEEQKILDEEVKKANKRHSLCLTTSPKEVDFDSRKRSSLKARFSGDISRTPKQSDASQHPTITIETTDEFRLAADTTSLHVALKKSAELTENNVFRRIDCGQDPEGHGRLNVFQLHSNPSYYLATTNLRHLELQSYCDDTLDPECPDERFFRCFHSIYGAELVQPYAHKGYYIHHIDNFINVRKFELNFRPPEEFFFNFEIRTTQEIRKIESTKTVPMNTSSNNLLTVKDVTSGTNGSDSQSNSLTRTVVPDISKSSLKRKDSKKGKNKTKDSPITPKSGMLSCFGLSGLKKKKDKSKR